jgi:hypothetical protein
MEYNGAPGTIESYRAPARRAYDLRDNLLAMVWPIFALNFRFQRIAGFSGRMTDDGSLRR